MASSSTSLSPPFFNGENYQVWAVKMRAYLKGLGLWKYVEEDGIPAPLRQNPTLQQIRNHEEEMAKGPKALSFIHAAVSDSIFTRIMTCESAKEAWDRLKLEFQGSEKTRQMQILNLRKEFEMLRMKEPEKVKDYIDRIMKIVNQIRLLGEILEEKRIVEKVMVTLPEKFEAKISSIEDTWEMSQLTITELSNALQAVEQRKAFRDEETSSESALLAAQKFKAQSDGGSKRQSNGRKGKEKKEQYNNKGRYRKGKYPPCPFCKKTNHTENFCWYRPGVQCRVCNQFGHVDKVCKANQNQQVQAQAQPAQVTESAENREENLFAANVIEECNAAAQDHDVWLVDSGCTNHMTANLKIFEGLDSTYSSKVRLGDGRLVDAKGKGAVVVQTPSGTKLIPDVLFVPEISQSLLSVGQLLDNKYILLFKDRACEILDPSGMKLLSVKMNNRSFPLNWKHTDVEAHVSIQDETCIWHKRFGHTNFKSLKMLQNKDLVTGIPFVNEISDVCGVCQLGKLNQSPFPIN